MKNISVEYLEDHSIGKEKRIVRIPLNRDEVELFRDQFLDSAIKLNSLDEELSNISCAYKTQIKEIKGQMQQTLLNLRNNFIEREEMCFLIDNQDQGIMEFYSPTGYLVHTRPLRPAERQLNLLSIKRKKE